MASMLHLDPSKECSFLPSSEQEHTNQRKKKHLVLEDAGILRCSWKVWGDRALPEGEHRKRQEQTGGGGVGEGGSHTVRPQVLDR